MAKQKTPKNPPNTENEETEETEETEDEDTSKDLDNRINSIVTNRLKRFGEQFTKTIETTIANVLTKAKETEEHEDEETPAPKGKQAAKPDPKLSKLERELAETRKALESEQAAKKAAEEKAKRDEERQALDAALNEAGITDKSLRGGALALLMSEGRITRDEDGKIKWKGQDKYGSDTLMDPAIAAKAWVKTDGKAYQPAVDASGSGAGRPNASIPKAQWDKMSQKERAKEEIRRASLGLPPIGD